MKRVEITIRRLAASAPAFRTIADHDLLAAWNDTLSAFLDVESSERRELDPNLLRATGLSPAGLDHGFRTIGAGMLGRAAASELHGRGRQQQDGFSLVVLPASPPGLILQSLLPALAARAPVLFKSSRAEPFFAPAFLAALGRRLPVLRDACAAAVWTGGDASIEASLYADARLVIAYGNESTIASIKAAGAGKLIAFGPRLSLGWVGADADLDRAARDMAFDIALFDQRGCLSVVAVLVDRTVAVAFAGALAAALRELATALPPGRSGAAERAGVRLAREDAELRGLICHGDALDAGTVIVENDCRISPSPGLRTVRIHCVSELPIRCDWRKSSAGERRTRPVLDEWNGRLQGIGVAGHMPDAVRRAFEEAGVSRFAPAGELQATDASWRNGGINLAAEFAHDA